eukprot:11547758-Heterocapsa_arctica.AAC.1
MSGKATRHRGSVGAAHESVQHSVFIAESFSRWEKSWPMNYQSGSAWRWCSKCCESGPGPSRSIVSQRCTSCVSATAIGFSMG